MIKKMVTLLAAVFLLAGLAACSTRPPSEEIWLIYSAGSGDDKKFKECVEPGTKGPSVVDDEIFSLPTSLRTWNVANDDGADSKTPFVVASLPAAGSPAGPQMSVWATVDFYLNTDCDITSANPKGTATSPVVQFWEKTGRRPWVDGKGIASDGESNFNEDAWIKMLKNILVSVEGALLQTEGRKYAADDLDSNANDVWTKMEKDMSGRFNEAIRAKVGGDYFCGVTYDRKKDECPPVVIDITSIDYNDPSVQTARNEVLAAKIRAEADVTRARAQLEKAKILAEANNSPGYLELARLEAELEIARMQLEAAKACSANPNCTLVVGATGGVNVGTK